LRTSFESDEDLASIEVSISGAEALVLTATDFSESVSGGSYTYEATYEASSDGDYTATLDEAADESGNDGAGGQSVTLTVESQAKIIDDFESGNLESEWIGVDRAGRDGFSVQSDPAPKGNYALQGVSSSSESTAIARSDFTVDTNGASIQFYAKLGPVLTGYERANKLQLMVGPQNSDNDKREEIIMFDQKDRSRAPGNYTPPEGQITSDELRNVSKVEVNNIRFSENIIGEIRINDQIYAENIEFIADHSKISTVRVVNGEYNNNTNIIVDDISYIIE
jgi:hypothetical protein